MDQDKNFIIYIPGLFTTSLYKGNEQIWPINKSLIMNYIGLFKMWNFLKKPFTDSNQDHVHSHPLDQDKELSNYVDKLTDPNLVTGLLINTNDNLIHLLKSINDNDHLFVFCYDWTKGFNEIISKFSEAVQKLKIENKNITIISHSAGGIIGYKYLNSEQYKSDINFSKINKFITIGCPIQGSIKALTALLGLCQTSIVSPQILKNILDKGAFRSFYELFPINIKSLFQDKKTRQLLSEEEIINLLADNNIHHEHIKMATQFRTEMSELDSNPNVDFLFIRGSYNKEPMCAGILVDPETKHFEAFYDFGSGDGTVLSTEAVPDFSKRFRTRCVIGKHAHLTEMDDTLEIISQELTSEVKQKNILLAKIVNQEVNKGKLEFQLYLVKNNIQHLVKHISAEKIVFSNKTYVQDLKSFDYNKTSKTFSFKTHYTFGVLKLRQIIIEYYLEKDNTITTSNESEVVTFPNIETDSVDTMLSKEMSSTLSNNETMMPTMTDDNKPLKAKTDHNNKHKKNKKNNEHSTNLENYKTLYIELIKPHNTYLI